MKEYEEQDLKNFSKEYLWEQLNAVEDDRNKLLDLCLFIQDNRDKMCIPDTIYLKGDCIDTWLNRLTGVRRAK